MKFVYSISFFLLLSTFVCYGEKALQLTDTYTGKSISVPKGSMINYRFYNDSLTHMGTYYELTDSSITIDQYTYPIQDIQIGGVYEKSKKYAGDVFRVLGTGVLIAGDLITNTGLQVIASGDSYSYAIGGSITLVGLCLWAAGHVIDFTMYPFLESTRMESFNNHLTIHITDKGKKKLAPAYDDDVYGE